MPEHVELRYGRLPGCEHLTHQEWATKIREAIAAEEERASEERRRTPIPILGVRTIKDRSPHETPATSEERFGIKPRVAAKSKWARIEALQRNEAFIAAYRQAYAARRRGESDVAFPYGTYQLRLSASSGSSTHRLDGSRSPSSDRPLRPPASSARFRPPERPARTRDRTIPTPSRFPAPRARRPGAAP